MKLTITGTADGIKAMQTHYTFFELRGTKRNQWMTLGRFYPSHRDEDNEIEFVVEEPKRWRAEKRGVFYTVTRFGKVNSTYDFHDNGENALWEMGNYFRTEAEAEAAAEKIRAVLRGE